jgi:glycosyltransferase involved in cell wall biosynthesis
MELLKGPVTAVEAIACAVKEKVAISLTLCGIDLQGLRPVLEARAAELGVRGQVSFADAPDNQTLVDLYRRHDVFVFPTRIAEGFGLVCAEAMACGLPVIGSPVGGQTDIIRDGVNGFLVPPDAERIAHQLVAIAHDRDLLAELSGNAVLKSQRYAPDSVIDLVEASLLDVAGAKPTRG